MTKTQLYRALESVGWEKEIYLYDSEDGDLSPVHAVEFVNCAVYRSGMGQRVIALSPVDDPKGLKVPVLFDAMNYDEVFRWSPPKEGGYDPNEYTGGE